MKKLLRKWIETYERPALILAAALLLTLILVNLEFTLLESNLYDFRMTRDLGTHASSEIVLVTIDDFTTASLNEFSPLSLDYHVKFLETLERLNPKAVGYLVDMNHVNQSNPDLFRGQWGTRFVAAASKLESRGIPILLGTPFDVTGEVVPPYPLSSLPHSVAVIHKDGNVFSGDKVSRRALSHLYDKPVFHLELAERLGLVKPGFKPRGSFYVPEVEGNYFFFNYHGPTEIRHSSHGVVPYTQVSFREVLEGAPQAEKAIRGKIILVGTLTKDDSSDYALTPYSKSPFVNPKLIVHANILDSVIQDDGIVRAPAAVNWLITFAMATFVFWWVMKSAPLRGLIATVALGLVFVGIGQLLFSYKGIWIREGQPLIAIFFGYYLAVPYRLIVEYKKRWDYQKQNELLLQVEQLKTNFMSLVTHDLKTPVARIQGLAEVLLRKAGERLVDRDKETVHHIIGATDELNRFISSILELSKLESKRLHINPESRDLNQLVERCVESFRAPARAKEIEIVLKLEPLFPLRIDAGLISKVLNNLIDNAIKYSPEGSLLTIETKEIGDQVEISIVDQGIGMNEQELNQLFTRFYRAKNDATSKVAGTGLGLYLTKFFIEAHQGSVTVESEIGRGSTFRIRLPIEGAASAGDTSRTASVRVFPGLLSRLMGRNSSEVKKENTHA